MQIKKIRLENIRSYENQEVNFPSGSTLLSGDIGAGKTSVLLAIEFALFGLQPSQRGSSLLRNGEKSGKVVLELDIGGKTVILERVLKRTKTIGQEASSISVDNEKFEGSVTEIKDKVLKLLNYPSEFAKKTNLLYKFTVYTPQEEMKQIILDSAETRLNTLRHIFGIDKYKKIEENLSVFNSKLREEIRNKEGQLSDVEGIKRSLETMKESILNLEKEKEKENSVLQEKAEQRKRAEQDSKEMGDKVKEKEVLEKEKEKSLVMLANKKEISLDLGKQIQKIELDISEGRKTIFDEKKLQDLIETISRNKEQEKNLQENVIKLTSQINSLNEKKREGDYIHEKISNLQKCPTCLQEVDEDYKKNIFKKIESEIKVTEEKLLEIEKQKAMASESLGSLKKQIELLENKRSEEEIKKIKLESLKEKEKSLVEIMRKKKQNDSDVELMLKHTKSLGECIGNLLKFTALFENKQKQIEQARQEEKLQEIRVAEISKEISLTYESIRDIEKKIKEKQELKKKVDYLKELENWLSSKFLNLVLFTEKNVMLKLREEFSNLFSQWFSVLVPEGLSARLDEQFSPIMEQQGYELSYAYLSGGERTAVALAYRLALNQVINSLLSKIKTSDLIILDEPTDGFSETQLDRIRDVLSQLKVQQLILVSHEAKIESFVENIIKFKKDGGITKIER